MARTVLLLILCSFSTTSQILWTKHLSNPIMSPGQLNPGSPLISYWQTWMPMVIFDNGLYKMWYVGYGMYSPPTYSIGYAISEDGINWFHYEKNPVLQSGSTFDNGYTWGGTVMKDGSEYKMYYGAYSSSTQKWSVGLATSTDGMHWTKRPTPVLSGGLGTSWDADGTNAPSVFKEGPNQYSMCFTGFRQGIFGLGYATSTDGMSWTKHANNPILAANPSNQWESSIVTDGRVVKVGSTYHMFYHGASSSPGYQIGYAYSSDGIQWTRYEGNPVVRLGTPGSWESFTLSQHWVTWQDSTFKMWYGARDNTNQIFQIGYATSPLTPTSVPPEGKYPVEFNLRQNYPNPFNPATTIGYDVPSRAHITLKIYNMLGQEVASLVNEEKMPGTYSAVWDAKGAASGTYWSRMSADGKSVVQKMILLK